MDVGAKFIKEHGDQWTVFLKNIYRGSQDGYTLNDFFDRVSDHTHTIFFCKVAGSDHVFGGYNKIGYKTLAKVNEKEVTKDFKDTSAFIFSLNHRTKHEVQSQKAIQAVRHTSHNYLIVLGLAPDIGIRAECNILKQNEK